MHIWIDPETAAPDEAITKLSVAQCGCNNERRRGRRVAILGAMLVGWDLDFSANVGPNTRPARDCGSESEINAPLVIRVARHHTWLCGGKLRQVALSR